MSRSQRRVTLLVVGQLLCVLHMALAAVAVYALFIDGAREQLSQELRVRSLFAYRALDIDATNRLLSDAGVSITISGEVDRAGTPQDDYVEFAHSFIGIGEERYLYTLLAVSVLSMCSSALLLVILIIVCCKP